MFVFDTQPRAVNFFISKPTNLAFVLAEALFDKQLLSGKIDRGSLYPYFMTFNTCSLAPVEIYFGILVRKRPTGDNVDCCIFKQPTWPI